MPSSSGVTEEERSGIAKLFFFFFLSMCCKRHTWAQVYELMSLCSFGRHKSKREDKEGRKDREKMERFSGLDVIK